MIGLMGSNEKISNMVDSIFDEKKSKKTSDIFSKIIFYDIYEIYLAIQFRAGQFRKDVKMLNCHFGFRFWRKWERSPLV